MASRTASGKYRVCRPDQVEADPCRGRFLAFVDLLGTTYTAPSLATGYGAHIALPILREAVDPNPDAITEDAAREILRNCMRVLFYRDARSLDKVRAPLYAASACIDVVL